MASKEKWIFFLLFLIMSPALSRSQTYTIDNVPYDNLKNRYDFVSNPDGILSQQAEQQVNSIIININDSATAEIAVVLLKSIGNADIDNFGTDLFTKWGIGNKGNDNGLLFLLVEDQRQMIFRSGYGLEGVLPDIILSRIIRNDISPWMAQGNPDQAIISGISRISDYLLNPEAVQEILAKEKTDYLRQQERIKTFLKDIFIIYLVASLLIFACFFSIFLSRLKRKTNVDKYNGLNVLKISVIVCTVFFPLLMLFFAIVYFEKLKKIRNTPVVCPLCNQTMVKQSEAEEDTFLTPAQIEEKQLKSVDYDVWHCNNCGHNEIPAYDNPRTKYTVCPHCQAKTYFFKSDRVLQNATTFSKGRGERIYKCLNCSATDSIPFIIPMIIISSGLGGGGKGGFGGGGSFGGGFGGGRTGGGGARGGW
jgi:uncharacterized protein